jgi:hypothetical protein
MAQIRHGKLANRVEVAMSPDALNSRSSALTVLPAMKSAAMSAM